MSIRNPIAAVIASARADSTINANHPAKPWTLLPSLLVGSLLLSAPMPSWAAAFADEDEDPYADTPLVTQRVNQFSSSVELGVRYLTDDAFKFGEYNSQEEQGWQLDGAFDIEQRDFEDGSAKYMRAEGSSIGTQSRAITLELGQQGDHKLQFSFKGSEKQVHGVFSTPYDLTDPNNQTLTVANPADLEASWNAEMRSFPMHMQREKFGILFKKNTASHWNFTAKADTETKTGLRDSGIYASKPTIVAYPIDYQTDTVNLGAEYVAKDYQVQLGYELSSFSNAQDLLVIDNPTGNGSQAGFGQEPDNRFQQLSLAANYRFTPTTRGTAFLGYSVGEQDEALVQASINDPSAGTTPRDSAEAKVKNLIARLGVSSRVTHKLTLNAKYNYQDKDNQSTPYSGAYPKLDGSAGKDVPVDTFDYDTKRQSLELNGYYRLPKASKLGLGYKREKIERPGQDREKTNEDKLWASYKLPMLGAFSGTLKLSVADREGSAYTTDAISTATLSSKTGDPLTRRLTMADRIQRKAQFNGQYQLGQTGHVGLMLQRWQDDYDKPSYGLQDLDGTLYTVDFGASPLRTLSYSLYAGVQRFEYDQKSVYKNDDWTLLTDDRALLAGLDINWEAIENRLKLTFGYRYSETRGELTQTYDKVGAVVTALPDLKSEIHTLELGGEYYYTKQLTLLARAVYEDHAADNWAFDGVDAVANDGDYLSGGMVTPNHTAGLIELGLRYQF